MNDREILATHLNDLHTEIAELRAENALLRKALADAPHADSCDFNGRLISHPTCTCWKAALARAEVKP